MLAQRIAFAKLCGLESIQSLCKILETSPPCQGEVPAMQKAPALPQGVDLFAKVMSQHSLIHLTFFFKIQVDRTRRRLLSLPVSDHRSASQRILVKEPVVEGLLDCDPPAWIELQHILQHVAHVMVSVRKLGLDTLTTTLVKAANVASGIATEPECYKLFFGGSSKKVEDHVHLVTLAPRMVLVVMLVVSIRAEREARCTWEERASILKPRALQHTQGSA